MNDKTTPRGAEATWTCSQCGGSWPAQDTAFFNDGHQCGKWPTSGTPSALELAAAEYRRTRVAVDAAHTEGTSQEYIDACFANKETKAALIAAALSVPQEGK